MLGLEILCARRFFGSLRWSAAFVLDVCLCCLCCLVCAYRFHKHFAQVYSPRLPPTRRYDHAHEMQYTPTSCTHLCARLADSHQLLTNCRSHKPAQVSLYNVRRADPDHKFTPHRIVSKDMRAVGTPFQCYIDIITAVISRSYHAQARLKEQQNRSVYTFPSLTTTRIQVTVPHPSHLHTPLTPVVRAD